ncbi:transposase [Micromonospora sp. NPDC023814]|uniref:RNA-guided endonuclease InsQ/TnpB family protein n=1 Tax=Micromonospora sp. NPDC023814 TaxID=3154596 RepID=UPI0033EEC9D2
MTGRRYLLAFTDEQVAYAEQVGAACRAVWNTALEQRREYRRRGGFIGYVEQARQMAEAKKDPHCAWLADAPSHTLQQTLRDVDRACRTHGTWRVRWRSKSRTAPSFRFPDPHQIAVRRLSRRWGEVRLPKFGAVRFRWTRPLGGATRSATVSRSGGRWHISRVHGRNRRSGRRDAVRAQLGRLHARIRDRRADFAARTAVRLVRHHGTVVVEDLRIRNMTASAKGTIERPGRNVRQKAGLNRAILAKGWGGFLLRLEQVARYHGAQVVKIDPAYTSQTCNACTHVARESRESQAVFRCVACGHQDNADVNAAKNILAAGLAVTGRGDLAVGRSVKRQPPERLAA